MKSIEEGPEKSGVGCANGGVAGERVFSRVEVQELDRENEVSSREGCRRVQ